MVNQSHSVHQASFHCHVLTQVLLIRFVRICNRKRPLQSPNVLLYSTNTPRDLHSKNRPLRISHLDGMLINLNSIMQLLIVHSAIHSNCKEIDKFNATLCEVIKLLLLSTLTHSRHITSQTRSFTVTPSLCFKSEGV